MEFKVLPDKHFQMEVANRVEFYELNELALDRGLSLGGFVLSTSLREAERDASGRFPLEIELNTFEAKRVANFLAADKTYERDAYGRFNSDKPGYQSKAQAFLDQMKAAKVKGS